MSRTSRFVLPALAAVAAACPSPRLPGAAPPRLSPRARPVPRSKWVLPGHDGQHGRADRRGQSENLGHLQPDSGGKPTPDLKVGLVAYRDKGDVYVTQVHDLTDDSIKSTPS